jgi:hypothetical protein
MTIGGHVASKESWGVRTIYRTIEANVNWPARAAPEQRPQFQAEITTPESIVVNEKDVFVIDETGQKKANAKARNPGQVLPALVRSAPGREPGNWTKTSVEDNRERGDGAQQRKRSVSVFDRMARPRKPPDVERHEEEMLARLGDTEK